MTIREPPRSTIAMGQMADEADESYRLIEEIRRNAWRHNKSPSGFGRWLIKAKMLVARILVDLMSLKVKLIIPYVLLTLLTAMVGTFIVTRLVSSSVRERFINQLYESSRVCADGVIRHEKSHLASLRLMAYSEGVSEAIAAKEAAALQELLWPLALNNNVAVVTALDSQGREIISLAQDPETGHYNTYKAADFSQFSVVKAILEGSLDDVGDKFAGLIETRYGSYLYTSAPIFDAYGNRVGILMAGTRVGSLLEDLKLQALADIVLLDSNGNLIATTFAEPQAGYDVFKIDATELPGEGDSFIKDLKLYGRNYQIVYSPLEVRREIMGIKGIALPSDYLVDTETTSRNTFAGIFSIATIGVIIIGYFLSQSIARPIIRLRDVSRSIAEGDLSQRSGLQRKDEIGDLAAVFDLMTFRLRRRTAQAAKLHAETVQRNKELAEINTRLQATQLQLTQSEKLAAVGQLTAGIVHDVKNPLAVIKGLAEELEDENSLEEGTHQTLKTIRDSASRASRIVSDLLKFARQSAPQMMQQDLAKVVRASIRLTDYLARKGNVRVVVDLPSNPVMVEYDAQQIEQVLINLIQNAIQAMPNGGTLDISMRYTANAAAIVIRDTGAGISPDNMRRIFDPFFTTKTEGEGTGLGLSVSYGIIARHRGQIDVKSEVGKGSIFTILLPTSQDAH